MLLVFRLTFLVRILMEDAINRGAEDAIKEANERYGE